LDQYHKLYDRDDGQVPPPSALRPRESSTTQQSLQSTGFPKSLPARGASLGNPVLNTESPSVTTASERMESNNKTWNMADTSSHYGIANDVTKSEPESAGIEDLQSTLPDQPDIQNTAGYRKNRGAAIFSALDDFDVDKIQLTSNADVPALSSYSSNPANPVNQQARQSDITSGDSEDVLSNGTQSVGVTSSGRMLRAPPRYGSAGNASTMTSSGSTISASISLNQGGGRSGGVNSEKSSLFRSFKGMVSGGSSSSGSRENLSNSKIISSSTSSSSLSSLSTSSEIDSNSRPESVNDITKGIAGFYSQTSGSSSSSLLSNSAGSISDMDDSMSIKSNDSMASDGSLLSPGSDSSSGTNIFKATPGGAGTKERRSYSSWKKNRFSLMLQGQNGNHSASSSSSNLSSSSSSSNEKK
jgi:trimeric autotransporter adhesin